jgi:hypothetical protein
MGALALRIRDVSHGKTLQAAFPDMARCPV